LFNLTIPGLNLLTRNFGYDAATDDKKRKVKSGPMQSEDKELTEAKRKVLVASHRDLRRNFEIAAWAIRKHLDFVSTFTFQCRSGDEELDKEIESLVKWWQRPLNFDEAGRHSMGRFTRIAEACNVVDGDFFIHKLRNGRVQGIESDLVRRPMGFDQGAVDASEFPHGVRTNAAGRALRYAVHQRTDNGMKFQKAVPAVQMIHVANFDRISQTRGISPLAASYNRFRDVYENLDYALAKSKVAQLFGLVFYRDAADSAGIVTDSSDGDTTTNDEPQYDVNFGTGPQILDLEAGDKAEFLENKTPSTEFREFMFVSISMALKSLDIPYSFFDEAHTNFFGSKAALILYMQSVRHKRSVLQEALRQLTVWRFQHFIINGDLVLPSGMTVNDLNFEWVPAGVPWFDPRDIKADVDAINAGLKTRSEVRKEKFGDDWRDVAHRLAAEENLIRDLGITGIASLVEDSEPTDDESDETNDKGRK